MEEAVNEIRAGAEDKGAERERAETEERSWYEAEIREEADRIRA